MSEPMRYCGHASKLVLMCQDCAWVDASIRTEAVREAATLRAENERLEASAGEANAVAADFASRLKQADALLTSSRAENERLREVVKSAGDDERALIVADLKRLASEHPTLATVLLGFADRYERKLDRAALKGGG